MPAADAADAEAHEAAVEPAALAAVVETAKAHAGPIDVVLTTLGVVRAEAAAEWSITSSANTRVVEVAVAPGQRVAKGALLLRLDQEPLASAVAAATADVAAAVAELAAFAATDRDARTQDLRDAAATTARNAELAQTRLQHLRELHGDGLVAERTVGEADAESGRLAREQRLAQQQLDAWNSSGAGQQQQRLLAAVAAARERQITQQGMLQDVEIRAPADGSVAEVSVRVGDRPAPGTVFGRLLVGNGRRAELAVPPDRLAGLPAAAPVTIDDGQHQHHGQLSATADALDPTTGLGRASVQIDADDAPPLLDGAAVRAEIVLQRLDNAVLVPAAAVVRSGDEQIVVKVDAAGIAHHVPVHVLTRRGDEVAVVGAITGDDTVVVRGAYNLPDGAHVVVSPTNGEEDH